MKELTHGSDLDPLDPVTRVRTSIPEGPAMIFRAPSGAGGNTRLPSTCHANQSGEARGMGLVHKCFGRLLHAGFAPRVAGTGS